MNLITTVSSQLDPMLRTGDFPVVILPIIMEQGNGIVAANTILGRISISGKFVPYDEDNFDGSEVARAILKDESDTTNGDYKAFALFTGIFNPAVLIGLDQKAVYDLMDRSIFMNGVQ